jgi:hypothetical protein
MITTKIIGGLGNQMFQYAIARALAEKNKDIVLLDISSFETYKLHKYCLPFFNITGKPVPKKGFSRIGARLRSFFNSNIIVEKSFTFEPNILKLRGSVYLDGYWQTEKYFKDISDIIRQEFTLKTEFSIEEKEITKQIKNTNAVSLHIRRGDYVTSKVANDVLGVCPMDYYQKAMKIVSDKFINPTFFVFSDDIEWAKENLNFGYKMVFVEGNKNYEDMRLMNLCKHNIIANSSFSWWGAWLNNNPGKIVIAPKKWFNDVTYDIKDLIPESWMQI